MRPVILLARSLNYGGAERQIVILAGELKRRGLPVSVVVCYGRGPLQEELEKAGVSVICLNKRHRWDLPGFYIRLVRTIKKINPSAIYGFLDLPNLLTFAIKPFFPSTRMIWGVRVSSMDLSRYDWLAGFTFRMTCRLSRFADHIVFNSQTGLNDHIRHGFPHSKSSVIHNGIDTGLFRPDESLRSLTRRKWGISDNQVLIGVVARIDPMKDHPNFMRAAKTVAASLPEARFVCIGAGEASYMEEMRKMSVELGLTDKLKWLSPEQDTVSLYNALDILVSSSAYGEGFSNVIGEAMACGVPCAVTDVGDSAVIVDGAGEIVPSNAPHELAEAILRIASQNRKDLGQRARERIETQFGVDHLVEKTKKILWPSV